MLVFVILIICSIVAFILVVGGIMLLNIINSINPDEISANERLVDISLDISEQINYFMLKYQISPKEFCKKLKISDETLLVWLSGVYDFKLSQLTRIEAVFNEHLIKSTLINRKKLRLV